MSAAAPASGTGGWRRAIAVLVLAAGLAVPAQGGGPLTVYNQQPVVYAGGGASLTLNVDQGPFGSRTNGEALALVRNAVAMWNGVGTSTMRIALGAALPADYTSANFSGVLSNFTDGLNPIVFDTDGSITDLMFGVGAKSSVLGFAGSAWYPSGPSAGRYAEGEAVLNGWLAVSDATWTVVLAHEIGHFFGLDHSQLDATQGLATDDYVLMYPVAFRTLQSLHEDDVAAVTALYPSASADAVYGQLAGAFTTADGAPVLGANIWAREISTAEVFSVVSDFLMQGNGYFRLLLPAGAYTLHAESIAASFIGGSSVGPYANTATDASFLPPHPIAPVALGGAAAQPIAISAGCSATATFRLDGTGGVSGNCKGSVPTSTALASSANPAAAGASVTLTATVAGNAPTGTVDFRDGAISIVGCSAITLSGTGNSRIASCATSVLTAGTHNLVAVYAGDAGNAASSSVVLSQVINALAPIVSNVALASAGAVATASSTYAAGFPASSLNNNQRSGAGWGSSVGGWRDGTGYAFPDWVQITFDGAKTIDRVVVYTLQDNYNSPVEPTDALTFTRYGVTGFSVQTWNGSAWINRGTVYGNNRVKRTVTFAPVTTDRIRVNVNGSIDGWSRLTEIEAWSTAGISPQKVATTTTLASSANPAVAATDVTLTATVAGSAPTGNVDFRDGGASIVGCASVALSGTGNSRAARCTTRALAPGTHSLVATYGGDAGNAASTSTALSQMINVPATTSSNVALASAGAVATASSAFGGGYPASSLINNQRSGAGWGSGGAWKDATASAFPDWVQINFNGVKTIDRVVVYTVQDNYTTPTEPTDALTFSRYGVTYFIVQIWTGTSWINRAVVTGNRLVKRSVTFAPVATDRIRVVVNGSIDGWSRLTEIEAWGK